MKGAREKRGEINNQYIKDHAHLPNSALLQLLEDPDPQKRTVAAALLGQRKDQSAIPLLCKKLSVEKALYSKIALSNALVEIGPAVLDELGSYIGKIGKNQHESLPTEIFKKKSYPLPRDIAIRAIIRIGPPAIPYLLKLLNNNPPNLLSEIVDAIGHIAFYSQNQDALEDLILVFNYSEEMKILHWKVIRAFQGFKDDRVIQLLESVLESSKVPAHRWEAARSLSQIKTHKSRSIVKNWLNDKDRKVVEMAEISLRW